MKLSKTKQQNSGSMLLSQDVEKIEMKIDPMSAGHIIRRLTDLYSNPIEATVREIISNAIDTTKNLPEGERKTIEVDTPSGLSTSFIVKDYGEGMSKEELRDIYSQYGASTKASNMNQIGAYGLGAKAPLSYCSQFTVESTKDGVTSEIIVSSESDGNYTRFVKSEREGKPNGTKVTIPVAEDDEDKFNYALSSYKEFCIDTPLSIDGETYDDMKVNFVGYIPIPEVSKDFKLRVFTKLSDIKFLEQTIKGMSRIKVEYFLSGWDYSKSDVSGYGNWRESVLYVELVPGIVDFSSSRDEITENDRLDALNKYIKGFLADKVLIKNKVKEIIMNSPYHELISMYGKLICSNYIGIDSIDLPEISPSDDLITIKDYFTQQDDSIQLAYEVNGQDRYLGSSDSGKMKFRKDTLTSIRAKIQLGKVEALPTSIISINDSEVKTLIVSSSKGDKTAISVINRARTYMTLQSLYRVRVFVTALSSDEMKEKIDGLVDYSDFTFMTADEFMSASKNEVKKSTRRKSVKTVKPLGQISGEVFSIKSEKDIIDAAEKSWRDSEMISLDEVKDGEHDVNLIAVMPKDRRVSTRTRAVQFAAQCLIENKQSVKIVIIERTEIKAANVEKIASQFDSVIVGEGCKFIGKKVNEVINSANLITGDTIASVSCDSLMGTVLLVKEYDNKAETHFASAIRKIAPILPREHKKIVSVFLDENEASLYPYIDYEKIVKLKDDRDNKTIKVLDDLLWVVNKYNRFFRKVSHSCSEEMMKNSPLLSPLRESLAERVK